jgi:glycerate 2-kinase
MKQEDIPVFLKELLQDLLEDLSPGRIFGERLKVEGETLRIEGRTFTGPFYLLALGKAAWDSAAALAPLLGDHLCGGIALTRYGASRGKISGIEILEAGHPIPDRAGLEATRRIVAEIEELPAEATVVACISGGGSALFEWPLEGVSLEDLEHLNRILLASGATIDEVNEIRKGVSCVKGGGLLSFIGIRSCLGLIFSDVVGDDPALVASGPTVPEIRGKRWQEIFNRYELWEEVPSSILQTLSGSRGKGAHKGEVFNSVLLRNDDLCRIAVERLKKAGFKTLFLSACISGEASEVGRFLGDVAREIHCNGKPLSRPAAVITGGETVVQVRGKGRGGPNMETALGFARQVRDIPGVWLLSVDSDGADGSTEAAGGLVCGDTWNSILSAGLQPEKGLRENNSLSILERVNGLVMTGPTGTNLNDLRIVLMP